MPSGSFSLDYLPQALSSFATPTAVMRYDGSSTYTRLPNIVVVRIDQREGASPPVANFQYGLDDTYAAVLGWPSQIELIWPIDAPPNPYVVQNDDRIVVQAMDPSGDVAVIFDGFAQIPEAEASGRSQMVTFSAVGVAAREWDSPIRGRFQRNASSPKTDPSTGPVKTDLKTRFNPSDTTAADGGKGGLIANCTPDGSDINSSDPTTSYPVFLDEGIKAIAAQGGSPAVPAPQTLWTISKACRYLMAIGNKSQTYVHNPDFSILTALLQASYPAQGGDTISMTGDQTADIVIRDYDATDKAWPEAIAELLGYAGFGFSFVTSTGAGGFPTTGVALYRHDALTKLAPKQVFLQPSGGTIGQAPNNVAAFHLARDCNSIVNQWSIESPLNQVEVSFILAPLYVPAIGDKDSTVRKTFLKSSFGSTTTAITRRKYRWYGIDEIADGHWNPATQNWIDDVAFNFATIFLADAGGAPIYVDRYRPGQSTLISVDGNGNSLKADLAISFDYDVVNKVAPTIWDGTGDWFSINGGWKLLADRCGIEVTIEDPEVWDAGKTFGKITGISWFADPTTTPSKDPGGHTTNGFQPVFRLTTVIDDDRMLSAIASKRTASPTRFTRHRRADCADHFQYNRILKNSLYNNTPPLLPLPPVIADVIARDDTQLALAHAYQLRLKSEMPPLAGSITLPFLTDYYTVGDRISEIDGRNINLVMNVNTTSGEAPDYPFICGVSSIYQPEQMTILQLSDHRAEATNL